MKIEVSAKTIQDAIDKGLKQLDAKMEDVEIKVLSEGGVFKKCKIEITLLNEEAEQTADTQTETANDTQTESVQVAPHEPEGDFQEITNELNSNSDVIYNDNIEETTQEPTAEVKEEEVVEITQPETVETVEEPQTTEEQIKEVETEQAEEEEEEEEEEEVEVEESELEETEEVEEAEETEEAEVKPIYQPEPENKPAEISINDPNINTQEAEVIFEKTTTTKKDSGALLDRLVSKSEEIYDTMTDEEKLARKKELQAQTVELAKAWLDKLVYAYNVNAEVKVEIINNEIYGRVIGENLGVMIGYHGESMDALQHILNVYLVKKLKGAKRVFLDVSGYREKHIADLKQLAKKISARVLENKKAFKLEPMNSFERRVIHEELSTMKNILTHSEGVEPKRYLVVDYTAE